MINDENLQKLSVAFLENEQLATKNLKEIGFNFKDLNFLIKKQMIKREKKGIYVLNSMNLLYFCGKKLISEDKYFEAIKCFEKCFEINPLHVGTSFQLFLHNIRFKNYEKALDYFEVIYNYNNIFYKTDCKFYLYMLSMIIKLPLKYRRLAKSLSFTDIEVDNEDKRYVNVIKQNKIRLSAFNQKFGLALIQINEDLSPKGQATSKDVVINTLIEQALELQTQNLNTVLKLAQQKEYKQIIDFYEDMLNYHALRHFDNYIYNLTRELQDIISLEKIPEKQINSTENIFEAMAGKNYELALSLSNSLETDDKNYQVINILLNEIVNTCQSLNSQENLESQKLANQQNFLENDFSDMMSFLEKKDLDNAFIRLKNYLMNINKKEYEFLIIDLLKISLLENDIAFIKPKVVLTLLSCENYTFDISKYIQEFYVNLYQNNFEMARIYLDIISKANKLGQECFIKEELFQLLEKKKDNKSLASTNKIIPEQTNDKQVDNILRQPKVMTQAKLNPSLKVHNPISDKQEQVNMKNGKKHYLAHKHEKLLEHKEIILLKPMEDQEISIIMEIIKEYSDMVAFTIKNGAKKQIVLKYKLVNEDLNTKDFLALAQQAYKVKKYNECINYCRQILQTCDNPDINVYATLGLAYMKKWKIDKAIDYLTIATSLAKERNLKLDFSILIARLKGEISEYDSKPHFKMKLEDFYDNVSDDYNVENFNEINDYIVQSGLDVTTACINMGFTPQKINIIKLIYAQKYYAQKWYDKGDSFFKDVVKSKNKTKETQKLLEEVSKNKMFYHHRQSDNSTKLTLTLVPK